MSIVMDMSSYEIERASIEAEYGEKAMYAGWNPAAALMYQQQVAVSAGRQIPMSPDLVTIDAGSFLLKMYRERDDVKPRRYADNT